MKGETQFIKMRDDIELHAEIREKGHDSWLIISHGIGEHFGRHQYLVELFSGQYNLCFYDLRGHGLSMGEPASVDDFQDYICDLSELIGYLRKRYRMNSFRLFGHSMGALITASFMQNMVQDSFYPEAVYLSSPPVGFGPPLGSFIEKAPGKVFQTLSKLPFSKRLSGLVDLNNLSHDPLVEENYKRDKRNHLSLHSKLLIEMVNCSKETFSKDLRLSCPFFVSVGSEDHIVSVKAVKEYFESSLSNGELRVFEGAFHEVHNEVEMYRLDYLAHVKKCLG